MRKMNNDYILQEEEKQWTAYLNGEPDPGEFISLDIKQKEEFSEVWQTTGTSYSYSAADPDKGWSELQNKIVKSDSRQKVRTFRNNFLKYAASILIVMGIGFSIYQIVRSPKKVVEIAANMTFTETGAHPATVTLISLPDGSTAKLNANTKIEYPEHFTSRVRTVKLSGEAFFEVTKDSMRPFRIETANASVEVLGTSFNVSAYPGADKVEVNVETGKVKLSLNAKGTSIPKIAVLPAGNRGLLKVSAGEISQSENLSPNYAAWITRVMSFQRTPLAEVCLVIENTYHIKIRIENSQIGEIPYTANFANLNSDYIIEVLARTHHLKVKRNGDEIILARRTN